MVDSCGSARRGVRQAVAARVATVCCSTRRQATAVLERVAETGDERLDGPSTVTSVSGGSSRGSRAGVVDFSPFRDCRFRA